MEIEEKKKNKRRKEIPTFQVTLPSLEKRYQEENANDNQNEDCDVGDL